MRLAFIPVALILGGCSLVSEFPKAIDRPPGTGPSPLVAYEFDVLEPEGFADVGRFGAYPLMPEGMVEVEDGGVVLDGPDYLVSPPVTGFNVGVTESRAMGIEMWIATGNTTQGDVDDPGFNARILNVSENQSRRNVTVAQWLDGIIVRLRRGDGEGGFDDNGLPDLRVLGIFEDDQPHHHVLNVSGRELKYWVDGEVVMEEMLAGEITSWNEDFALTVGDELEAERYWTGTMYDLRMYDQPVDEDEIRRAAAAGPPEGL